MDPEKSHDPSPGGWPGTSGIPNEGECEYDESEDEDEELERDVEPAEPPSPLPSPGTPGTSSSDPGSGPNSDSRASSVPSSLEARSPNPSRDSNSPGVQVGQPGAGLLDHRALLGRLVATVDDLHRRFPGTRTGEVPDQRLGRGVGGYLTFGPGAERAGDPWWCHRRGDRPAAARPA